MIETPLIRVYIINRMLHYYETFNKIVELFLSVFLEIALK